MIDEIINSIPYEQRCAVDVIRVFLSIYNTKDGQGLFSGISRYPMLESRAMLAGVRAGSLLDFWAILRRSLNLDIPPKQADEAITRLWALPEQSRILKCFATSSAEVIMIARMLHDNDKAEKKLMDGDK